MRSVVKKAIAPVARLEDTDLSHWVLASIVLRGKSKPPRDKPKKVRGWLGVVVGVVVVNDADSSCCCSPFFFPSSSLLLPFFFPSSSFLLPTDTAPEVCSPCASGQYSVATVGNTGASECKECVRGKSQNHANRDSPSTSSHQCNDCAKGQYTNQKGQPTCAPCAVGYYQPVFGDSKYDALACKNCVSVASLLVVVVVVEVVVVVVFISHSSCFTLVVSFLLLLLFSFCFYSSSNLIVWQVTVGLDWYQDQPGQENCKACGTGQVTRLVVLVGWLVGWLVGLVCLNILLSSLTRILSLFTLFSCLLSLYSLLFTLLQSRWCGLQHL